MYLDYWSLQRNPFDAAPDSRSFFPTPPHEHALAAMSYAACQAAEPVLLTGPVGCGKTLLLRTLRRQLPPEQYQVVFVPELGAAEVGLLRRVAYHLAHAVPGRRDVGRYIRTTDAGVGCHAVPPDTAAAMDVVLRAAAEADEHRQPIIVMLDDWPVEATPQAFNELRWLLNLDVGRSHVCVLLTAEPFDPQVCWPPRLRQRLLTCPSVGPLEVAQVPEYLAHRLRRAGHPDGRLFTAPAAALVAEWSGGNPRRANRLAHLALQVACLQKAQRVEPPDVTQAIDRLGRHEPGSFPVVTGVQP